MILTNIIRLFFMFSLLSNVLTVQVLFAEDETEPFNYQIPVLNDTEDKTSWDDLFKDGILDESLRSKLANDPFLVEIIQEERRRNITDDYLSTPEREPRLLPFQSETTTTTTEASVNFDEAEATENTPRDVTVATTTTTVKPITRQSLFGGFVKIPKNVAGAVRSTATGLFSPIFATTQPTTTKLPQMHFDDEAEPQPEGLTLPEKKEPLKCNGTETEYEGKCHTVLKVLPCKVGEWLVEDDSTGKGKCEASQCAQNNTALFGNTCVQARSTEFCHRGMMIHVYKNGKVECDCKEAHLFNELSGNCYPAMRRGPCKVNHIFTLNKQKVPACEPYPCSEGYVCNAARCPAKSQRGCVKLGANCECPNCEHGGIFDINPQTFKLYCQKHLFEPQRIVGNVPTLVCAPGSRRDILGSCRKPSDITFS